MNQFIVFAFLFLSCSKGNISKKNDFIIPTQIKNLQCKILINNNLKFLQKATKYYVSDYKINDEVYLYELINCCLEDEFIVESNIKKALLDYCKLYIEDRVTLNMHPTFFNKSDAIGRILTKIIDENSFNLHLKIFSFNKCDKPGHGVETSTGVGYFEYIMLPLISKINGIEADKFYANYLKENFFFKDTNDCALSYYRELYQFIKQAWEDGKIELKDVQINE